MRGVPTRRAGRGGGADGFTLVKLMILVTVLNVVVAAALPLWTQQIKRDKEEELIFRGLQYAEAIRLFQERFGRYPVRLEELLEVEPRSIRQLWTDPMSDNGKWGLVFAAGVQTAQGQAGANLAGSGLTGGSGIGSDDDEDDSDDDSDDRSRRRRSSRDDDDDTVTTGPISGVHSLSDEDSVKTFMGSNTYSSWVFTPDIIPIAPTAPGEIVPSLNSRWIGRPFPEGVEPEGGGGLDDDEDFDEDSDGDEEEEDSGRRDRRRRRRSGDGG